MKKEYTNEIWKPIKGYEGLYEVSNFGRVRSLDHIVKSKGGTRMVKGRIIQSRSKTNGYMRVNLWKDNVANTFLVHRLVAEAFLDNPNNYTEVNHKDENKQNNKDSNLEWCTHQYNMVYGTIRERIKLFYKNKKCTVN